LLAEAFWLLEGYFVRTLGMHRVYNSAFMNMLRDERNAEYRQLIRSTLEFDPQILKRYVNFMSNPDERTAVDQFGTGDKYFGVATLMATMPGLPMFGHGQIEGLAEKYGMEFHCPRWDEVPNDGLVWRHELQLFPLLRRRHVFAEVDRFLLYDFVTDDGWVDENVFAYSNDIDGERSLVVYHNRFGNTRGRLQMSTGVAERTDGEKRNLVRTSLGDGLRLPDGDGQWLVYRDAVSRLEFLRPCRDLRSEGFSLELDAYRLHCFLDFREVVEDESHPWSELAGRLQGRGVRCIDDALGQLQAAAVLEPFRRLLSAKTLERLASSSQREEASSEFLAVARIEIAALLEEALLLAGVEGSNSASLVEGRILTEMETLFDLARLTPGAEPDPGGGDSWMAEFENSFGDPVSWAAAMTWVIAHHLGKIDDRRNRRLTARELFSDWHLRSTLVDIVIDLGRSEEEGWRAADTVDLMIKFVGSRSKAEGMAGMGPALIEMVASDAGQRFLRANEHGDVLWFHREAFEELLMWVVLAWLSEDVVEDSEGAPAHVAATAAVWRTLRAAAEASGFRLADFLETLRLANDLAKTEK
jgi:hypothetical protein